VQYNSYCLNLKLWEAILRLCVKRSLVWLANRLRLVLHLGPLRILKQSLGARSRACDLPQNLEWGNAWECWRRFLFATSDLTGVLPVGRWIHFHRELHGWAVAWAARSE